MRIGTTTAGWAFAAAVLAAAVSSSGPVKAQPATQIAQEVSQPATDLSAQRRGVERPPTRLRIHPRPDDGYDVYPRYNPGPNAVRARSAPGAVLAARPARPSPRSSAQFIRQ